MADTLLIKRGINPPPPPLRKNWALHFINSQPQLKIKWNQKFYLQRAKCEDLDIINI